MKQLLQLIKISMKSMLKKNIGNKLLLLCTFILFLIPAFLYNTTSEIATSLKNQQNEVYGTFDEIYYRDSAFEIKQLSKSDLDELLPAYEYDSYGVFYTVEKQELEGNRYLYLGFADENALDLGCVSLAEGRYPESNNEIALTYGIMKSLKISDIGDSVEIDGKVFTLCGIVNDFGRLWPHGEKQIKNNVAPVNAFITSYCTFELSAEKGTSITEQILLKSKPEIVNSNADSERLFSNSNNSTSKSSYSVPTSFMLLMYIVSLIIIISLLILNKKNLIKRSQNYYLLGMPQKKIRFLITFELLFISLIGILLGLIVGSIATKICVYYLIGEKAALHYKSNNIRLISGSILGLIIIYFTHTSSIISNIDLESDKRSSFYHFNENKRIGFLKYDTRRNIKTIIAVTVLISMSCMLVSYGAAYKKYYTEDVTEIADGYIQRDYDFQIVSNLINAPPLIDPETGEQLTPIMFTNNYDKNGADEKLVDSIKKIDGVTNVKAYKENQLMNLILKQEQIDDFIDGTDGNIDNMYNMPQFFDINDFEFIFNKFEYDPDDVWVSSEIVGYSEEYLASLSGFVIDGEINIPKILSGEEVILRAPAYKLTQEDFGGMILTGIIPIKYSDPQAINLSSLKVGDEITLSGLMTEQDLNGGVTEKELDSFYRKDVTVKIGAIIRSIDGMLPSSKMGATFSVLTANDAFDVLGVPAKYSTLSIYTDNKADNEKIAAELSELCVNYPKMTFENWSSDIRSYKIYNMLVGIFAVTFIIILIVSSLILLSSQLYIKTRLSASSYSLFRINGLSFRKLLASLSLQNIVMFIIGAILSYPITQQLIKISMKLYDINSVSIYLPMKNHIIVIVYILLIYIISSIPSVAYLIKQKNNVLKDIKII